MSSLPLLKDLDLTAGPGRSLTIMGPSGCGKSSLLRAIAGMSPLVLCRCPCLLEEWLH